MPRNPTQKACDYYLATGNCVLGPACKWDHPPRGETPAEVMVPAPSEASVSASDGINLWFITDEEVVNLVIDFVIFIDISSTFLKISTFCATFES